MDGKMDKHTFVNLFHEQIKFKKYDAALNCLTIENEVSYSTSSLMASYFSYACMHVTIQSSQLARFFTYKTEL